MKVLSVRMLINRKPNTVAIVRLDGPEPTVGSMIYRKSDRFAVKIIAVEWFAIMRRPRPGDTVGLLLSHLVEVGDEFERE